MLVCLSICLELSLYICIALIQEYKRSIRAFLVRQEGERAKFIREEWLTIYRIAYFYKVYLIECYWCFGQNGVIYSEIMQGKYILSMVAIKN